MFKKIAKNLLIFILLAAGLLAMRLALAADFGVEAVNSGLAGSLSDADPRTIVGRIINIALGFLGVIAVGFIIYAGFIWMTSGGNEENIIKAKNILKNAVIGLIIILASWGIATFIISRLSGAVGGTDFGSCTTGQVISCGCGGTTICSDGSWSACVGSNCSLVGGGDEPIGCSANLEICSPVDQICAPNDYCDHNDCLCKDKVSSGDSCNADPSQATCQADDTRCGAYSICNPETCLCQGAPVITGISPVGGFCLDGGQSCFEDSDCAGTCDQSTPNGSAGNLITIFGRNFGDYVAGNSRVIFQGGPAGNLARDGIPPAELNAACVDFWSDNQIVIAVPSGVVTGPIAVVDQSGSRDSTNDVIGPIIADFQANNIVRPGLCALSPVRGALSSEVDYQGVNLYAGDAYFGNYQSNVLALESAFVDQAGLSGSALIPNIKSGDSGSFVQKNLGGNLEKSNYLLFTKEKEPGAGPFISAFSPSAGPSGQYVTIRGRDFGGTRGLSRVYFNDTEAVYDFPEPCADTVWGDDQIMVKVPNGLSDGQYAIRIDLGGTIIDTQALNPGAFQIDQDLTLQSSICKIEPKKGPVASPVTLWGEYFGRPGGAGLIKFNFDKNAAGTIASDGRADMIETSVPVGAITGPVYVINKSEWGNEVNFTVGECSLDAECGTQICCPQDTYKKGRCVDDSGDCFLDIPTSVFEWSFSTGFGTSTPNPYAYSCAGLSDYYGSCQTGSACPNVPGNCSPYAGGGEKIVAVCDFSCGTLPGCGSFGSNNCSYDATINKCVKNGDGSECDLNEDFTYELNNLTVDTVKTCNANGQWEIATDASCPVDWVRTVGDKCIDPNSSCSLCSLDFKCEKISPTDSRGSCVSAAVCPSGATCRDNPVAGEADSCVIADTATCDCCCTIGQDTRDCCAPLTCEGTCGADTGKTSGATLGRCGGCASAGDTPAERDAACNCSGHTGQYCDINNPAFPDGVCSDCSGLSQDSCEDHSGACCFDSRNTAAGDDDVCRGGLAILGGADNGYCAYYNCSVTNPTECAADVPAKTGDYTNLDRCKQKCADLNSCSNYKTLADCQTDSRCCFDTKNTETGDDDVCSNGVPIADGADSGYCAYYNCSEDNPSEDNPNACALDAPFRYGAYNNVESCERYCDTPPSGQGLSCAGETASLCSIDSCNFPGFDCFSADGDLGTVATGCGTCCCDPQAAVDSCSAMDPNLECLADKGSCSGAGRGLCCGCSQDTECGSPATVGCGLDTCCEARPEITDTLPERSATGVCRNAVVKVNFNQLMDLTSFTNNVLLLEERNYGDGVCPTGTFIVDAEMTDNLALANEATWWSKLTGRIGGKLKNLSRRLDNPVLADVPDPSKLYCAVPGTVSGENDNQSSALIFAPKKILAPATNYYLIVLGDTELNSQTGVLSLSSVGFNGWGYWDAAAKEGVGAYVEGKAIEFNGQDYVNSHIIKFSTLSGDGPTSGICAIDHVSAYPTSYLFKTSENSLDENDVNPGDASFDTQADKDKVFAAWAYSDHDQILQPVTGYFWDWDFSLSNSEVATIATGDTVRGLPDNKILVTAKTGVTDAEAEIVATINMDRFLSSSCASGACSCQGSDCFNSCCNVYSGGDGFNESSSLYVFLCDNPWPPVSPTGIWSPWVDTCEGSLGADCANYNYKFYYCRDAGGAGTLDDLPAIVNEAVIRGLSANLICSSDNSPCSASGDACGLDKTGDGIPDGLCIWNVLKESYFFREAILSAGEIISAVDQKNDGQVKVTWRSNAESVGSYKIYYLPSGQGTMLTKEVLPSEACTLSRKIYNCETVVTNLINDSLYVFKMSVISVNKTESDLSGEVSATPTDQLAPQAPTNLSANLVGEQLTVSWRANTDDTVYYRLRHGLSPLKYGESFDSPAQATQLVFSSVEASQFFTAGRHYLVLTALDDSDNESAPSREINFLVLAEPQ
ncbi:TPA: hypothetical protein DCZ15_01690 [Candidatus Falkowbacteria bacterium]|nr:hypothetical protein [Candidatus Falkowbacteria bacterium]